MPPLLIPLVLSVIGSYVGGAAGGAIGKKMGQGKVPPEAEAEIKAIIEREAAKRAAESGIKLPDAMKQMEKELRGGLEDERRVGGIPWLEDAGSIVGGLVGGGAGGLATSAGRSGAKTLLARLTGKGGKPAAAPSAGAPATAEAPAPAAQSKASKVGDIDDVGANTVQTEIGLMPQAKSQRMAPPNVSGERWANDPGKLERGFVMPSDGTRAPALRPAGDLSLMPNAPARGPRTYDVDPVSVKRDIPDYFEVDAQRVPGERPGDAGAMFSRQRPRRLGNDRPWSEQDMLDMEGGPLPINERALAQEIADAEAMAARLFDSQADWTGEMGMLPKGYGAFGPISAPRRARRVFDARPEGD